MDIRLATQEDSRALWEWRNDAHTRAMSINPDEVAWDAHVSWYAAAMANDARRIYVGALDGASVGMVRFDLDEGRTCAEVSINLNPLMRGKGLSAQLLGLAIDTYREDFDVPLKAQIKAGNAASVKCFEACGFALERAEGEYLYFQRD